jgi:Uma2 family endonuclease
MTPMLGSQAMAAVVRPTKRPATYADVEALPENVVGEIVDGELLVSPRPAVVHAAASSAIGADVMGPFQFGRGGPGGWWILDEPELHLHPNVVVPDLAGWRKERMPRRPRVVGIELAPDWACEVLSPSTAVIDRTKKMDVYARANVPWLWMVDPIARTLEVYRLDTARWVVAANFGDTQKVRAEPFDAVERDLSLWWLGDDE